MLSWSDAVGWREAESGLLVFTNGVFDLLHPGHIDLLTVARTLGDRLIVGLNTDASVRRLKGPDRPVRTEAERAYIVAALECVDAVTVFDEDTPLELIEAIRPDVLVKGGDYSPDTIVGRTEVESWGGSVHVVPLTAGHSTTRIIEALRGRS
ncbi:MAG: D-glycero-beta-D-manno-heptose 1-phosphate adenylyltransferase [Gemmatimonadaceae bacterium]